MRSLNTNEANETNMKYLKALWQFCSYVFVPQRRPHPEDGGFTETRTDGTTESA